MDVLLKGLQSIAEPTRLRVLGLCAHAELTVSELVHILGQSQPRVSRHLKLLMEAGLLERNQEGNWAYFRLSEKQPCSELARLIIDLIPDDDPKLTLDLQRLQSIKEERGRKAQEYFGKNAAVWHEIRSLHIDSSLIENAFLARFHEQEVGELLDIGTGTGRVLELVASDVKSAIGVDISREMLAIARNNIDRAGLGNCQVRQGDMYQLPFASDRFDAVSLNMVLHYALDPRMCLREAARVLKPGGRVILVDFAPHRMDSLRDDHAHHWLGFEDTQIEEFCSEAGLTLSPAEHLPGDPLTVCIWTARRDPGAE
ncbi:metalloregulator ArsR/SmtB family transcription factor [Kiloniella laminariae]|uniref:Metalloregulator ArsR/SmtB family transcription factor n=1 Tax=Kiloniella laminariae TaxID=454162 RepID=A0ABT4LIK1_9PROT|nr:metalloregulator ArsR/SmtB family transcription factor [Kiloniella laminariae]MCZ4280931.1 metalloregulator ArsR/SmtB family transcription factor [Kiloniella laminariae]